MATLDELSLTHRFFMKSYPFSRNQIKDLPAAPLARPLNQARVALVTTAGIYAPGQPRFESTAFGDHSFREIPGDIETAQLLEGHNSSAFDHRGVAADRNLALPLDRFRELAARGEIGALNHRHFSFMGSIIKPGKLIAETAPEVAALLREDKVDAVFLTPV
jgi:D-proline reductase (dithiol) PrdB